MLQRCQGTITNPKHNYFFIIFRCSPKGGAPPFSPISGTAEPIALRFGM